MVQPELHFAQVLGTTRGQSAELAKTVVGEEGPVMIVDLEESETGQIRTRRQSGFAGP